MSAPPVDAALQDVVPAAISANVLRFSQDNLVVNEGDGALRIVLERTGGAAGAASVTWWTEPGTALPDADYADFGPRTERFEDGETQLLILIPIASDTVYEDNEYFYVLQEDMNGHVVRATLTIRDDD